MEHLIRTRPEVGLRPTDELLSDVIYKDVPARLAVER